MATGIDQTGRMIVTLTVEELCEIVRSQVRAELQSNGHAANKREWLKAEELAAEYGLPKTWFEERGRAGDIARAKPGRYVLFKRRDVEAYLDRNKGTEWPKRKKKTRTGG
jgi:hypothetical protein